MCICICMRKYMYIWTSLLTKVFFVGAGCVYDDWPAVEKGQGWKITYHWLWFWFWWYSDCSFAYKLMLCAQEWMILGIFPGNADSCYHCSLRDTNWTVHERSVLTWPLQGGITFLRTCVYVWHHKSKYKEHILHERRKEVIYWFYRQPVFVRTPDSKC